MASKVGFFRKVAGRAFVAATADTEAWAEGIDTGQVVKAAGLTIPRNYAFHCKYWAMMVYIYKHQTRYANLDDLDFAFRMAIGHGYWIETKRGPQFRPHSISFAKMDEPAFRQFYNSAIEFVIHEVIPGISAEDVQRELAGFA